jgi:hypothetical protein
MARESNASLLVELDLEAGHTTAIAAAEAAYPGLSAVRAYSDTTTGYGVVTLGKSAVDGVAAPITVVVNGSTLLYSEVRPDSESYSQVIARVEERLLTQRRRPRSGSLTITGNAATRT